MKTGFLQSVSGNDSSSRLFGFSIVYSAIIFLFLMVGFCFLHPDLAVAIIGVSGATFTILTAPTFIFLYNQKKQEVKQETNTTKDEQT